jgi:hypothetical protein
MPSPTLAEAGPIHAHGRHRCSLQGIAIYANGAHLWVPLKTPIFTAHPAEPIQSSHMPRSSPGCASCRRRASAIRAQRPGFSWPLVTRGQK